MCFHSLAAKLIAVVLGGCLVVSLAILLVNAGATRERHVRGAQNDARAVARIKLEQFRVVWRG